MKRLAILAAPALAVLIAPAFLWAQAPPKKGPNEASLRQMEMAAAALETAVEQLDERGPVEARKSLRQAVNHAHKAGRILLGKGPTESQRRGIALVLQGTLEVGRAIELVDEARVVYRENWKAFQKAEKEAFQMAREERKAELAAALAEAKAKAERKAGELAEAKSLESGDAASVDTNGESENGDDTGDSHEEDESDDGEEEPEYFDPESDALLARAEHAARDGLEQVARGLEVFPRRF